MLRQLNRLMKIAARLGIGGTDICVCPNCGHQVPHERGIPCNKIKCPKCGTPMIGLGMPHGQGQGVK